ncbi:hypothetical protein BFW01_g10085 [Lasiodiplodia theobromae]|nr:hypothetical protein BFW01_g10085 [Lasiodiplodia theobromae]
MESMDPTIMRDDTLGEEHNYHRLTQILCSQSAPADGKVRASTDNKYNLEYLRGQMFPLSDLQRQTVTHDQQRQNGTMGFPYGQEMASQPMATIRGGPLKFQESILPSFYAPFGHSAMQEQQKAQDQAQQQALRQALQQQQQQQQQQLMTQHDTTMQYFASRRSDSGHDEPQNEQQPLGPKLISTDMSKKCQSMTTHILPTPAEASGRLNQNQKNCTSPPGQSNSSSPTSSVEKVSEEHDSENAFDTSCIGVFDAVSDAYGRDAQLPQAQTQPSWLDSRNISHTSKRRRINPSHSSGSIAEVSCESCQHTQIRFQELCSKFFILEAENQQLKAMIEPYLQLNWVTIYEVYEDRSTRWYEDQPYWLQTQDRQVFLGGKKRIFDLKAFLRQLQLGKVPFIVFQEFKNLRRPDIFTQHIQNWPTPTPSNVSMQIVSSSLSKAFEALLEAYSELKEHADFQRNVDAKTRERMGPNLLAHKAASMHFPFGLGSKLSKLDIDGKFHQANNTLSLTEKDLKNGPVDISSLPFYPLGYAEPEIDRKLRRRGETFWKLRKPIYVTYSGLNMRGDFAYDRARFLVDSITWKRSQQGAPVLKGDVWNPSIAEPDELDEDLMLQSDLPSAEFPYLVPENITGFNMQDKKWVDLQVDNIFEVEWDKRSFDNLAIAEENKKIVKALVLNKIERDKATDIVPGKGNGLVILLHGGPGTGKTLTAESVADLAEKPLYRVTCGDIGTEPRKVEEYLENVFFLGKLWDCVVLLDEADVFLEQRSLSDLPRNALVSVFLRTLEYYDGILILTSNRVGTFDEAFKSRIQLALHYDSLNGEQRKHIWYTFIKRLEELDEPIEAMDIYKNMETLAAKHMNGRQIRNAITTARQLALFEGNKLNFRHLQESIKVSGQFDEYLHELHGPDDRRMQDEGIRLAPKSDPK